MTESKESTVRLLITCPDQPGIVAAVSGFLHAKEANIIHSDQHSTDPEGGRFFMRNEFYLPGLDLDGLEKLREEFAEKVASNFPMDWSLNPVWVPKRMAILCSKVDHALMELLWRWKRGDLEADISVVISNHPDLREAVEHFGVPFHHVPSGKTLRDKVIAEDTIMELMGETDIIVLARYMQILTPDFVAKYSRRIINIHHSFLPAFRGSRPVPQSAPAWCQTHRCHGPLCPRPSWMKAPSSSRTSTASPTAMTLTTSNASVRTSNGMSLPAR